MDLCDEFLQLKLLLRKAQVQTPAEQRKHQGQVVKTFEQGDVDSTLRLILVAALRVLP